MTHDPDGTFYVIGVATRTDNHAESNPVTARLPELWQRAGEDPYLAERCEANSAGLVAVLTDYESDDAGAYTQVIGVRVEDLTALPERLVAVAIHAQPRRHVQAHGAMPEALINAWRTVWEQTADGTISRAYRTDYELHGADGADIYLSVNGPEQDRSSDHEPQRGAIALRERSAEPPACGNVATKACKRTKAVDSPVQMTSDTSSTAVSSWG